MKIIRESRIKSIVFKNHENIELRVYVEETDAGRYRLVLEPLSEGIEPIDVDYEIEEHALAKMDEIVESAEAGGYEFDPVRSRFVFVCW